MEGLIAVFIEWLHWLQALLPQADLVYLGGLIGILIALAPFYKKAFLFMYKNYIAPVGNFFSTFATLPDRLNSLEKKVGSGDELASRISNLEKMHAEIQKELKPNGGTSIKDVINVLATKMDTVVDNTMFLTNQANRMEARQQSLLNTVEIPKFETDPSGDCIFVNKAYLNLIGRPFDEIQGKGWVNVIHPDDRIRVQVEWKNAIVDNRNFDMEFRIIDRDRQVYRVYCEATPISGASNGYSGSYERVEKLGTL